ncbi:copA, partial [Symbiodinium microadriaticum]
GMMEFLTPDNLLLAGLLLGAGVAAGILAGLLGVGGGIVIVPVLFHIFTDTGIDPAIRMHLAVGTSLATIIPTAISSARSHHKKGAVDFDLLKLLAPMIAVGVLIGTGLATIASGQVLTAIFGTVAFLVAANMAFGKDTWRLGSQLPGLAGRSLIGMVIGSISALMGIGGGTLSVPILNLYNVPIHRAVGTASAIGLIIAVPGAIGFMVAGWNADNLPVGALGFVHLIGFALIVPATVLSAPWGAKLAHRLPVRGLKLAFALFLALTVSSYKPEDSFATKESALFHDNRGDEQDCVAFFKEIANGGPALEFAIGTGRIALPLIGEGVPVDGIDIAPKMIERLREKPGGAAVRVEIGDCCGVEMGQHYKLVFIIWNSFFNILTQTDQIRCFENAARHLTDDGGFVIEAYTPGQFYDGSDHDHNKGLVHDPASQMIHQTHVRPSGSTHVKQRYCWPAELDLMAQLAGMKLKDRFGGWDYKQGMISRRNFLWASGAALTSSWLLPAWASPAGQRGIQTLSGTDFDLTIGQVSLPINGKTAHPMTVDGSLPAPLLRFREGDWVNLRVTNNLPVQSSLHWHGILLPPEMDGVPGLSFDGIAPGETFHYRYQLKQSGTYWYHSHSGFQEQSGVYGPLIVDPAGPDPYGVARDFVVLLSDWTFDKPEYVFDKLKKQADLYNQRKRSLMDLIRDAGEDGWNAALTDRKAWGDMRMDPTDISDITAATYSYLINGHDAASNWTGLFRLGETLRLRFINAAAMTYFNVRIPGLEMTVIECDGQPVKPVPIDEFQIGVAETVDVLVTPTEDMAYTIFAETMGRSGYARATLAPRPGMTASIPDLRDPPLLTMRDMGMDHGGHGAHMGQDNHEMKKQMDHHAHHHHHHMPAKPMMAKTGLDQPPPGPGVDMIADRPLDRTGDYPTGLGDLPHRVLTYADLEAPAPWPDQRPPTREITLHLTGNMERYMWSFDGETWSEATEPAIFDHNERLRLTLINHTMMNHPIHLHGMWMELENGQDVTRPRKHTINVMPGGKISALITADAKGKWAFHCHLLFHMMAGMFRVVEVA